MNSKSRGKNFLRGRPYSEKIKSNFLLVDVKLKCNYFRKLVFMGTNRTRQNNSKCYVLCLNEGARESIKPRWDGWSSMT
jgi:hypothetical protein